MKFAAVRQICFFAYKYCIKAAFVASAL